MDKCRICKKEIAKLTKNVDVEWLAHIQLTHGVPADKFVEMLNNKWKK